MQSRRSRLCWIARSDPLLTEPYPKCYNFGGFVQFGGRVSINGLFAPMSAFAHARFACLMMKVDSLES